MRNRLQRDYVHEVMKEATRRIMVRAEQLARATLDKKMMVFGDVELDAEDTIRLVMDNAQNGVLDAMQTVNPKERRRQLSELRDAMRKTSGV